MSPTSLSILERAKSSDDEQAWRDLEQIYSPLLRRWMIRYEVSECDADDLVQEVLLFIAQRLKDFEHNGRTGAFRSWLRAALANRLRKFWTERGRRPAGHGTGDSRVHEMLAQLEDPRSSLSQLWEQEHDQVVLSRLIGQLRDEFAGRTWEVFQRTAIEGRKPQDVAAELQMTPNAVWIAKSRVFRRLRQISAGLIDSD